MQGFRFLHPIAVPGEQLEGGGPSVRSAGAFLRPLLLLGWGQSG